VFEEHGSSGRYTAQYRQYSSSPPRQSDLIDTGANDMDTQHPVTFRMGKNLDKPFRLIHTTNPTKSGKKLNNMRDAA
jgi:hypothetical protein